jgi:Zn-dependent protease with chaperone function
MAFLLMVFLLLVCLFADRYYERFSYLWLGSPALSAALTVLAMALVALNAFRVAQRFARPLRRDPALRDRLLRRYERGRFAHQFFLTGAYALALPLLGWAWAANQLWSWGEQALPGLELLVLAPFFLGQVLSWLFFYEADRAAWKSAQPAAGEAKASPVPPPFGGRWAYVAFQLRQKLALVCIPVALLVLQKGVERLLPSAWQWGGDVNVLGLAALPFAFLGMPWVVRLVLGLKPLPPGGLRDRLFAAARRLGFRCSDILLWNTRSGMANAMVVGLVPWLRYVVFTDRLVEEFPEEEVEAVFGHEAGHVKHHHMAYYLGFLSASLVVLGVIVNAKSEPLITWAVEALRGPFPSLVPQDAGGSQQALKDLKSDLAVIPTVAVLVSYIFLVFGFLSRRCERQADVFGCRAVSCGDPACRGHAPGLALPPRGRGLCPTGIRTFIQALEKVALVNGISRDRPGFLQSWQHSTIARRVAFLQRMLLDPRVEPAFQRRVALVKWALFALLALAALLIYRHELWL